MSLIALELPYAVAVDYQRNALIGAGGPTPGRSMYSNAFCPIWSGKRYR